MTPELRTWMRANVGGGAKSYLKYRRGEGNYHFDDYPYRGVMEFRFRDPQAAMLFKLAFA